MPQPAFRPLRGRHPFLVLAVGIAVSARLAVPPVGPAPQPADLFLSTVGSSEAGRPAGLPPRALERPLPRPENPPPPPPGGAGKLPARLAPAKPAPAPDRPALWPLAPEAAAPLRTRLLPLGEGETR